MQLPSTLQAQTQDQQEKDGDETQKSKPLAGQKRPRWAWEGTNVGEQDSQTRVAQVSLTGMLSTLSTLWDALHHPAVWKHAAATVQDELKNLKGHWVSRSALANLFWYRGDYKAAKEQLSALREDQSLVAIEKARVNLQLIICSSMGGGLDMEATKRQIKELLSQIMSSGSGSALQWYAQDLQRGSHAGLDQARHVPLIWSEVIIQGLALLLQVEVALGVKNSADVLVLSQVAWPRLGLMCKDVIEHASFDIHQLLDGNKLEMMFNVEILEMLFAATKPKEGDDEAAKGAATQTRQRLEKRMGSLGWEASCPVVDVLEPLLK
mmetsp:Transcript_47125/g.73733  ORF Transcript_47125/g.73733 Transcript_47125/m.73733 type:complete len:322 (+) Transcript_47125:3-968(+)